MKARFLFVTVALAVALSRGTVSAAPDPLSFDDPGMHYKAPDGWNRVPLPPDAPPGQDGKRLLAAYTYTAGKNDSRAISIIATDFDGTLDGAEASHETDLRNESDSTLVDHKTRTTLANGMPTWALRVTEGSDPFKQVRLFEYVIYDGKRMIVASYAGKPFMFSDDDAKKALASLYVVVYPQNRP